MANTTIQLKYSDVTNTPPSLNTGEPAYSNSSNKLYIGESGGSVVAIGGKFYTALVDAATDANTASAIVRRDASGIFSATAVRASLFGNANTASTWQTARTIGVSGDANGTVSIDGSANANIPLTLGSTGVSAGTYGGASQIPVFTVDSKGRLTSASNTGITVATTLNVAGDTGTGSLDLASGTLTIAGRDGLASIFVDANNTVLLDVDTTVVRSNTASLNQTIDGNITITGNLIVTGNTTTVDVTTLSVEDSLIALAKNNTSDSIDVGFYGHYNDGSNRHAGIYRHAGDKLFYVFDNYNLEPTANTINPADASFRLATLRTNLTANSANATIATIGTLTLTNDLAVSEGGTGASSFTAGGILIGNGTGALSVLANTGTAGTYANASHVPVITTDAYGRVSSITNTSIALAATQITSGTLPIARGGTNQTTFTTGQRLVFDGTSLASQANTTTTVTGGLSAANTISSLTINAYGDITAYTGSAIAIDTSQITSGTLADVRLPTKGTAGTYANASHVPVITTDAYGRVTAVTNTSIAIAATQITSGTLTVARGGTGNTALTNNGVVIGQGTSALTTVTSSTEGHVLQINASGVPIFAHLSGGSF